MIIIKKIVIVVFQNIFCCLYLIFTIDYRTIIRWVWVWRFGVQGHLFIVVFILVENSIHCIIIVFLIDFLGWGYFRDIFSAVEDYCLFLFFVIFLICHNFDLRMWYSSSLSLLSSNAAIPKPQFSLSSLSWLSVFTVFFFYWSSSSYSLYSFYSPFFCPLPNLHWLLWLKCCILSCA